MTIGIPCGYGGVLPEVIVGDIQMREQAQIGRKQLGQLCQPVV